MNRWLSWDLNQKQIQRTTYMTNDVNDASTYIQQCGKHATWVSWNGLWIEYRRWVKYESIIGGLNMDQVLPMEMFSYFVERSRTNDWGRERRSSGSPILCTTSFSLYLCSHTFSIVRLHDCFSCTELLRHNLTAHKNTFVHRNKKNMLYP